MIYISNFHFKTQEKTEYPQNKFSKTQQEGKPSLCEPVCATPDQASDAAKAGSILDSLRPLSRTFTSRSSQ